LEFDWLAADRDRRVARFSSSGYGPVPASVLERVADIDAAVELTDHLPVIGLAIEVPAELSGDYGVDERRTTHSDCNQPSPDFMPRLIPRADDDLTRSPPETFWLLAICRFHMAYPTTPSRALRRSSSPRR
jgi:hypothetical protein